MTIALVCKDAITKECDTFAKTGKAGESCGKKTHCELCKKHICPVCGHHYRMMVFAEDERGCCVGCVKVTTNDLEPFFPGRRTHDDGVQA